MTTLIRSTCAKSDIQWYHHGATSDGVCTTIAAVPSFASPEFCAELISLCEQAGFAREAADYDYVQATTDLEIDTAPDVRRFLITSNFVQAVGDAMQVTHADARPTGFDDMFVVKYAADEQRELVRHVDGGDISFMLALSSRQQYDGGGTSFDVLEDPLHLNQGDLVLFNAKFYHAGLPISRGTRYLLVGFCFTGPEGAAIPGHLNIALEQIRFDQTTIISQGKITDHKGTSPPHVVNVIGVTTKEKKKTSKHKNDKSYTTSNIDVSMDSSKQKLTNVSSDDEAMINPSNDRKRKKHQKEKKAKSKKDKRTRITHSL
eukprot:m.276485 g.276485  ORF g.276485 m.276485 type:complete len:317 (+) comp124134_c0_seq1:279-1229(+)